MADNLLSGFRALDLTDEKGFIVGKILATLGVETIKIEPPAGESPGDSHLSYRKTSDTGRSLYWYAFNTDKRSITLNLESKRGQDIFRRLVKTADFVLESFAPVYLTGLGLGYDDLSQLNPRIIMASITPFGQKGPYSNYKGCELIVSAMGGVLENTGDPDRPPVKESLESCYYHANVAAALGAITAHYYREISGEGQQIDISIQEVVASRRTMGLIAWEFDKRLLKRSGPMNQFGRESFRWIWRCKDGYVYWQLLGGKHGASANQALSQWISEESVENPLSEIIDWQEFDMSTMTSKKLKKWETAISRLFFNHTKREIAVEGKKRGINSCVANNSLDILEHTQLSSRNYWLELEHNGLDIKPVYPRHFFLSTETENFIGRRAPLLGEDNDFIYGEKLGMSSSEISRLKLSKVI
jgi:crotonobetainyl-CoA:carnitine CoA-transferase CaiB-like acyl-CoA transferase